ncbi:MAG: glycosyltransferase domain-containing protein [Parcubacteria group bacterium]
MQKQNRTAISHENPQIEIYTSIIGDRDETRNDIKCFTEYSQFKRPVMNAKIYKVLPHKYLDCDISIWVDGNIFPLVSKEELVDEFLGDADMALFTHPLRKNIWDEFDILQKDERFNIDYLQSQLKKQEESYRKTLEKDCPIWECNFIIRRNNDKVNSLMEKWWAEICRWQWRDQVSLPYVIKNSGVNINSINSNIRKNKFFRHVEHD